MARSRHITAGVPPQPPRTPAASILTRAQVAIVPGLAVAAACLALAISQLLRPDGQTASDLAGPIIIVGSLLFGFSSLAVVVLIRQTRVLLGDRAIGVYLLGVVALLVGFSVVALLDAGIASIAVGGSMLLCFYVGFVFPTRLARAALLVVLVVLATLQAAVPRADAIEVVSVFALAVTGWLVGRLPRKANNVAAFNALVLSRSDVLTRILNRRGFLEEFAYVLKTGAGQGQPVALAVIDLNGFKMINDEQGHAAGDEILAWVATRVATLLPPTAVFGRLGGDEFAVALPNTSEVAAEALAKSLHASLSERIGSSVGVAAQPLGEAGSEALFRDADLALYAAKGDPTRRVQVREVAPCGTAVEPEAETPPLTYATLRRIGGPRVQTGRSLSFGGPWVFAGFGAIAGSGAFFVASTWLWGGDSFFEEVIRFGGPFWIAANLVLGFAYRRRVLDTERPAFVPPVASTLLVGIGVGAAALSTGDGVTTPIIAGLYLKLLFDGAVFQRRWSLGLACIIVACWAVVLALGPEDVLWAVPLQLVLLVAARRLGQVGRDAFESTTNAQLQIALTDPLTGVLNRPGFMRRADEIVRDAAPGPLAPVVIALDLDDFKWVNDTQGHAAGDALLRDVAVACAEILGDEFAIGRVGGDEFVAIAPSISPARLGALVPLLDARLEAIVSASVGSGVYGRDGIELDQLLQVADHRAYAVKRERAAAAAAASIPHASDPTVEDYRGPERRRPQGRGRRSTDAGAVGQPDGAARDAD